MVTMKKISLQLEGKSQPILLIKATGNIEPQLNLGLVKKCNEAAIQSIEREATEMEGVRNLLPQLGVWLKHYLSGRKNPIFERNKLEKFLRNGRIDDNKWLLRYDPTSFDGKTEVTVLMEVTFEVTSRRINAKN